MRAAEGVPELKLRARGRAAAVPVPGISPLLAARVRDARKLALDIFAAEVAGLKQVHGSSGEAQLIDRPHLPSLLLPGRRLHCQDA